MPATWSPRCRRKAMASSTCRPAKPIWRTCSWASRAPRTRSWIVTFRVDMGLDDAGRTVAIDLEELLATRLLVPGNSGSGNSHLLRRLLEKSAGEVQQIVIDPEGDFVTLAHHYGHVATARTEERRVGQECVSM